MSGEIRAREGFSLQYFNFKAVEKEFDNQLRISVMQLFVLELVLNESVFYQQIMNEFMFGYFRNISKSNYIFNA